MGIPWSHITKEDYEDYYGEAVIKCKVHGITAIDSCPACDELDAEEESNDE